MNTYEFAILTKQLHLFYKVFESKQQMIDFLTEILEGKWSHGEREIMDVVLENPETIDVSYPDCNEIEIEENDKVVDCFRIKELSDEKISHKIDKLPSSYDSNGNYQKPKVVGYLIFAEYLKMRMTAEFQTKQNYNREKISATVTKFQCEIGEQETKDFEVVNFQYDGEDIFVESGSGDGWSNIEFVFISDDKGKVMFDENDELEDIISQLEKL